MARKKTIDLEAYSMLESYCIGINEYFKALRKSGFTVDQALYIVTAVDTYPATIRPAPNGLPASPDRIPYEDDEDED